MSQSDGAHLAKALIKMAFPPQNASACPSTIVFGVTNFDISSSADVPNFVDVPCNAVAGKEWGMFEQMTVYKTTVVSSSVRLNTHHPSKL